MECPSCDSRLLETVASMKGKTYICSNCAYHWWKKNKDTMYIIIRDPSESGSFMPRKVYTSIEQAETVVKKMAQENKQVYYIAKLIKRAELSDVKLEDC
jgi:DNA-directed RNA polymerase subunit M/transcription elongation factor TFIIS